jgi:inner membrane transporter RhtA
MIGGSRRGETVGEGVGLAVASVASVQFGAALAARLFPLIGPIGTVSLRLLGAAVVLAVITRPWRRSWVRADLAASAVFALVLVTMNSALYLALDRLPLATVITLEFLGPLGVSIATARSARERMWALPAAAGVALLGGSLSAHDVVGVAFALTAALCWAAYILVSGRIGRTGTGLPGLSLASLLGAAVMVPLGAVDAGAALWHPGVLALGLCVGVLSSAIPYSFDLLALRRLPTAVFGVLTSLNPTVAALAGLLVLGEHLPLRQVAGVALVTIASIGISLSATRAGRAAARSRGAEPPPSADGPVSAGRPAERPAGQQVGVDVEDALADLGSGVEDGAERGQAERLRGALDAGQQAGRDVGPDRGLDDVAQVLARNDEDVRGRLWVDVAEGERGVVGVHDVGRHFPGDDLAEQAVVGHNG